MLRLLPAAGCVFMRPLLRHLCRRRRSGVFPEPAPAAPSLSAPPERCVSWASPLLRHLCRRRRGCVFPESALRRTRGFWLFGCCVRFRYVMALPSFPRSLPCATGFRLRCPYPVPPDLAERPRIRTQRLSRLLRQPFRMWRMVTLINLFTRLLTRVLLCFWTSLPPSAPSDASAC